MKKENYSKIFIILCAINISCLLVSNIITVKTVSILGLIFTAGDILFPITYILNDVIKTYNLAFIFLQYINDYNF